MKNNTIDDFQIFVMNSFKGSALTGDILDKKWIFENIGAFGEEKINMAINELILGGFLDKNHTITDNGIAVFCPLKKSSIKSCFTTFLRICNVKANDCLDEIISDFSKNYAGSKIVWAKREQDYFLKTLIPDFISNGYIGTLRRERELSSSLSEELLQFTKKRPTI
jgi:hypothetical protein